MGRHSTFLLIIILASSSIIMVEAASAQSTPSVPQFSIQVVDYSYDVPATYSTDSFNGQQITLPGYHVNDIRVYGKIKNQHFTPYTIPNPNSTNNRDTYLNIDFYYSIRYKGHFGDDWRQLYGTRDVAFLMQNYGSEYTNFTATRGNAIEFREGDVVDFQVKAVIGYETWGFVATFPYRILNGEESEWSNILTVTISKDTTSSSAYATTIDNSPYPTLTSPQTLAPSVPELPFVAVLSLLVIIPVIATVLLRKKRS